MSPQRRAKQPKPIADKLLAIREKLGLSQWQLASLLRFDKPVRIAEYERGIRQPELIVLLNYAKLGHVSLDVLANENLELKFRKNWKRPRKAKACRSSTAFNVKPTRPRAHALTGGE